MKTQINNGLKFLILILLFFSFKPAPCDNNQEENAKELYYTGLEYFKSNEWMMASDYFIKSYNLFKHPNIAYMASYSYYLVENRSEAKKFAEIYLNYISEKETACHITARLIIQWANNENDEDEDYTKLSAQFSTMPIDKFGKVIPPPPDFSKTELITSANANDNSVFPNLQDYSGIWYCNDGGTYHIRSIDNAIWWYGCSADGGKSWANVFHGLITGKVANGNWVDLPIGKSRNSGELKIEFKENKIVKIKGTGGFWGSVWQKHQ